MSSINRKDVRCKKGGRCSREDSKRNSNSFIVVCLVIIILLLLLLLVRCSTDQDTPIGIPSFDIIWEDTQKGQKDSKTPDEIKNELNQLVGEGMINISMNMFPVFEDGDSEGNLLIMNEEVNKYPQVVEIYILDTNELIYLSNLIAVGHCLDADKLSVDLEAGTYACIAIFNAVDPETGILQGRAAANIQVKVLN